MLHHQANHFNMSHLNHLGQIAECRDGSFGQKQGALIGSGDQDADEFTQLSHHSLPL